MRECRAALTALFCNTVMFQSVLSRLWVLASAWRTLSILMTEPERMEKRRDQLIACAEAVAKLADHREIKPVHVRRVKHDLDIRPVLEAIVRRWTKSVPTRFESVGAKGKPGSKLQREHVVPCRVLVNRMITSPSECRALLEPPPRGGHRQRHAGRTQAARRHLYPPRRPVPRHTAAPIPQLPGLRIERYRATGIAVFQRS